MARILIILPVLQLLLVSISSAQIVIDPAPQVLLVNRDIRAITVPAGSAAILIPFSADPAPGGGDLFDVVSSKPGGIITLILPSGIEINASNATAQGFSYTIIPEGAFTNTLIPSALATSGTHTLIQLPPSSPPGTYQVKVNASTVTSDTLIIASYFSSSSVRAGLLTDSPLYRLGDTVLLVGILFDGSTPVAPLGTTVTASIGDPSDAATPPIQITLQDSGTFDAAPGDGIYTGTHTASQAGRFSAAMQATGISGSGVTFSRTASTTFRVLRPLASFDSFSDVGVDDNSNGAIDRVVVTANVNVQTAGRYQFGVSLEANNAAQIKASTIATLSAGGAQQVAVSFSATEVFGLGVNGPYVMKDAVLTYQDDPDTPVVDFRENAGNTSAYLLSSLDRGPLFFTGQNAATGVDTNGNSKFDILRIQAGVFASRTGFYQWSGRLVDPFGTEIDFFSSSGSLSVGNNTITFDFNGSKIGQNCENGPYAVRSVLLFGAGTSVIIQELFRTQAFSVNEFENTAGCNRSPIAKAGPDQTVECSSPNGTLVTLDGSGSSDPDGDVLSFEWRDTANNLIGMTPAVGLTLPLGTHTFTLTVDDGQGGTASDSVVITVHDTIAPTLNFTLTPNVLFPPNHKLVQIDGAIQVSDICDPSPTIVLVSISSNEPDNGLGDGDTASDIQGDSMGTDDRSFLLRAERGGTGTGRIYTVRYRAMDASGNMTFATAEVTVPHDRRTR